MTETPPPDEKCDPENDSAWVRIETPFDTKGLSGFLDDVERLFRINSLLVFENWQSLGNGEYRFKASNLSNGKTVKTGFKAVRKGNTLTVTYADGLKAATTLRLEPKPGGTADLVVTDDYGGTSAAEREARIDEVDKSLVQWCHDIHRYLRQWKRWSRVPGWKFYMKTGRFVANDGTTLSDGTTTVSF